MKNILFSPPDITQMEIDEVVDTLKSGWITTGPKTKKFENQIAQYCHTSKAVCLNSQTACAELTLRVLGIGPGDEVIVPAYTYTASCSVIIHVGATPVIVDSLKDSVMLDYDAVSKAITSKTKAIIPVDIAGIMVDYDRLMNIILDKKDLFTPNNDIQRAIGRIAICADGAHSFGAKRNGQISGSMADFTSFSFHAVKNLTTSEGGVVVWKDIEGISNDDFYKQYMLLSLHGQSKDALAKTKLGAWEYDIVAPNYKCNMTDIMASLGIAQLKRYPHILERRKEIIKMYNEGLKDLNVSVLPHYTDINESCGHLYLVRILDFGEKERNEFIIKMAELGVATNVHYKPLPMHTGYKNLGFDIKDYPNAYNLYKNEVTLPLHTCLSDEDVLYVIECFKKVYKDMI